MNIHAILRAALGPLVADEYHVNTFPQEDREPRSPAIRAQVVGNRSYPDQCGNDGGETDDPTVQFDIIAREYDDMYALAGERGSVPLALLALPVRNLVQSYSETFDKETRMHRGILTVEFYRSSSGAGSPAP